MDGGCIHQPRLTAQITDPPPIAEMVIGMPVQTAVEVLPRVFNLCRGAQSLAAHMAFGVLPLEDTQSLLKREILRDHILKLCFKWPAMLGLPPVSLPNGWQEGRDNLRVSLFGPTGKMPERLPDLRAFLNSEAGIAPVLARLQTLFEPGEACAPDLPITTVHTALARTAQENSVAGRQAHVPLMQDIASSQGKGPFCGAVGLALDVECCLANSLPKPATLPDGTVVVPAARGYYALWARVDDGRVLAFRRTTPTDHLCAPHGLLYHVVSQLDRTPDDPATRIILDLMDPCVPVTLTEATHA